MLNTPILQRSLTGVAIVTSLGILLHDTKFDEAVSLALPVVAVTVGVGLHHAIDSSESAHTHVERVSVAQKAGGIPRTQARDDHRRYLVPKYSSRTSPFNGMGSILWPNV